MAIPEVIKYKIGKFWNDEYRFINYVSEPFNDPASVDLWISQGYHTKICGELVDMRHKLPPWTTKFIEIYNNFGWKDIGIAIYRMRTGTVMPVHRDLYKRYVELFNLTGKEHTIRRALVLLEDWQSGHYLEVNNVPYVNWSAGDTVEWYYDIPHMAANIGLTDRYSLQVTGHL